MFGDYKIVLGVAPTRRDVFPPREFALKTKAAAMKRVYEILGDIPDLEVVTIEDLVPDGLLMDIADIPKIVDRFQSCHVDALFVPHVNFGQEEAVAKLAKALNKPVLLWGPRDEVPPEDFSTRQSDTQCGLFVSGKALKRHKIPFTYIENCWLDDPSLPGQIEDFIRTVSVVKKFRGMRIGQVSVRPRQFLSTRINENQLLEKFQVDVVALTAAEVLDEIEDVLKEKDEEFNKVRKDICDNTDHTGSREEELDNITALECAYLRLGRKYNLDAIAADCWSTYPKHLGIVPCFANGDTTEKGLPVACECDVHGALTTALLFAAARGEGTAFLADLTIRHPFNDNGELLWHCGPFPKSLAKDGVTPKLVECQGRYELKGGPLTVARFDDDEGNYQLFIDNAKGVDGPPTGGNYLWMETDNWPAWERKLVCGPYIHHIGVIHGDYARILREAVKYMNGVMPDRASRED